MSEFNTIKSDKGHEMYVNVGAKLLSDKTDIPTKSALKRLLADNPGNVMLYETTMGKEHISYVWDEMDEGVKYTVTGPNPYNSRKWYATVQRSHTGKITVK